MGARDDTGVDGGTNGLTTKRRGKTMVQRLKVDPATGQEHLQLRIVEAIDDSTGTATDIGKQTQWTCRNFSPSCTI